VHFNHSVTVTLNNPISSNFLTLPFAAGSDGGALIVRFAQPFEKISPLSRLVVKVAQSW